MPSRYRWFSIGVPQGIHKLASTLRMSSLSVSSTSGFSSLEESSLRIEGEFLAKSRLNILRAHPDGTSSYEVIDAISSNRFSIFERGKNIWLRIADPPRSSRYMTDALERSIGMGFFASPVIFTEDTFNEILQNVDQCRLIGAKGIAPLPSSNAVARIEIASKDGLEFGKIKMLDGLNYSIDSALFEIVYQREKGQVSFAKNGLVKISGHLSPRILSLIEESLQ